MSSPVVHVPPAHAPRVPIIASSIEHLTAHTTMTAGASAPSSRTLWRRSALWVLLAAALVAFGIAVLTVVLPRRILVLDARLQVALVGIFVTALAASAVLESVG